MPDDVRKKFLTKMIFVLIGGGFSILFIFGGLYVGATETGSDRWLGPAVGLFVGVPVAVAIWKMMGEEL